jgi:LmbE family N-acetylglucosaminyl deacetylase
MKDFELPNFMTNVLVLAPHTDDGELGCGGTVARLVEHGCNVTYVAFSTADKSLPNGLPKGTLRGEVMKATGALGIKPESVLTFEYEVRKLNFVRQDILEHLVEIRSRIPVDVVLMPSLHDLHQDHSTVAAEGLRAFKNRTILGYELIWNNLSFNTTCFVRLEERHIRRKADALKEYHSQAGKDYMSEEFVYALSRTRGVQIGHAFAECFEVIRYVV